MKSTSSILIACLAAVALAVAGFISFDFVFGMLQPKDPRTYYVNVSLNTMYTMPLWFGAVCGLYPIALYLVWRFTHVNELKDKVLSGLLVLMFMLIAVVIRYWMIKSALNKMADLPNDIATFSLRFEDLNYSLCMFIGLLIGSITTALIFRKKVA